MPERGRTRKPSVPGGGSSGRWRSPRAGQLPAAVFTVAVCCRPGSLRNVNFLCHWLRGFQAGFLIMWGFFVNQGRSGGKEATGWKLLGPEFLTPSAPSEFGWSWWFSEFGDLGRVWTCKCGVSITLPFTAASARPQFPAPRSEPPVQQLLPSRVPSLSPINLGIYGSNPSVPQFPLLEKGQKEIADQKQRPVHAVGPGGARGCPPGTEGPHPLSPEAFAT